MESDEDTENEQEQPVMVYETDPTNRYEKHEYVGQGSFKRVYHAQDHEKGVELTWNVLELKPLSENERKMVEKEYYRLKSIHYRHVIDVKDLWFNQDKQILVFINEMMSSGTLKRYITKYGPPRIAVFRSWCRQILGALNFLHTRQPQIIHRDLKCSNIFIHGQSSLVKLGDIGLSKTMRQYIKVDDNVDFSFCAPEMMQRVKRNNNDNKQKQILDQNQEQDESDYQWEVQEDGMYNEKVDIYAFGICMIEILTGKRPYAECSRECFKRKLSRIKKVNTNSSSIEKVGLKVNKNEEKKDSTPYDDIIEVENTPSPGVASDEISDQSKSQNSQSIILEQLKLQTQITQMVQQKNEGIMPDLYQQITDESVRKAIERCLISDPQLRPSAQLLLEDPFFGQADLPEEDEYDIEERKKEEEKQRLEKEKEKQRKEKEEKDTIERER
ncbi:MAG: hypothetical protein EZS28_021973, partial [Streblomastix strix]